MLERFGSYTGTNLEGNIRGLNEVLKICLEELRKTTKIRLFGDQAENRTALYHEDESTIAIRYLTG
jgi:hypothetical protein